MQERDCDQDALGLADADLTGVFAKEFGTARESQSPEQFRCAQAPTIAALVRFPGLGNLRFDTQCGVQACKRALKDKAISRPRIRRNSRSVNFSRSVPRNVMAPSTTAPRYRERPIMAVAIVLL